MTFRDPLCIFGDDPLHVCRRRDGQELNGSNGDCWDTLRAETIGKGLSTAELGARLGRNCAREQGKPEKLELGELSDLGAEGVLQGDDLAEQIGQSTQRLLDRLPAFERQTLGRLRLGDTLSGGRPGSRRCAAVVGAAQAAAGDGVAARAGDHLSVRTARATSTATHSAWTYSTVASSAAPHAGVAERTR